MLSKEAVKEFQKIYFQEYGRRISYKEALKQGTCLLSLYKSVFYKPNKINVGVDNDHKPVEE